LGPQEVDEPTRLKLHKVAALWHRGSTDERRSAVDKLLRIATEHGWHLSALLQAHSIEGPADWTFATKHSVAGDDGAPSR
jgi:hypothetical protein